MSAVGRRVRCWGEVQPIGVRPTGAQAPDAVVHRAGRNRSDGGSLHAGGPRSGQLSRLSHKKSRRKPSVQPTALLRNPYVQVKKVRAFGRLGCGGRNVGQPRQLARNGPFRVQAEFADASRSRQNRPKWMISGATSRAVLAVSKSCGHRACSGPRRNRCRRLFSSKIIHLDVFWHTRARLAVKPTQAYACPELRARHRALACAGPIERQPPERTRQRRFTYGSNTMRFGNVISAEFAAPSRCHHRRQFCRKADQGLADRRRADRGLADRRVCGPWIDGSRLAPQGDAKGPHVFRSADPAQRKKAPRIVRPAEQQSVNGAASL